ncbi:MULTISPECIES: tRNA (guanosine(37)-N1)-methyltransferase TrmD [unclassified Granulicatella]|uniref:tRNA (guanosine(37)-N1)-methyltransferase TrmD n=1 Tax=unclassified Granulicatella TaxID=2630493 RepID=UPI0010743451|nr:MULTISPECIES: tRNA (guanosine(37)-N1)-methyltransferase TrmD [unclassified Granulicatella]MBF0780300.1 tRNA (guanosine(37)-N1)-methyltransferase TrmD [Granulicatella sp. 19428wC4_WM01]TFU95578.1 tRNA (guanosine(37)-N1)-methyltransferase TrmD [Granulicatella sp. WM01]
MKISVLSLFPEMFSAMHASIIGKAQENNIIDLSIVNFREFARNKQKHVDDYPFGGGVGMLLKIEPLVEALESVIDLPAKSPKQRVILLDPSGKPFTQHLANEFSKADELIFICGHYEGYDARIKQYITDEVSLGDYVLTGGELAAMVMIDATVRLLPDVLGNNQSALSDSHANGLLEHPQYTRPREYRGMCVPDVLISGNHKLIDEWKERESLRQTLLKRPDLLEKHELTEKQLNILEELRHEL